MELSLSDSQPCSSKWDESQSKRSGHCCSIDYQWTMSDSLSQVSLSHPATHTQTHTGTQLNYTLWSQNRYIGPQILLADIVGLSKLNWFLSLLVYILRYFWYDLAKLVECVASMKSPIGLWTAVLKPRVWFLAVTILFFWNRNIWKRGWISW